MSSIPDLQQADNGVWYIHWTEGRRSKRISTRQKDLHAAKAFLGQWLLMEREAPADAGAVFTVEDLWGVYEKKHIEPKVQAKHTAAQSWKHLSGHFGPLTLAQVGEAVEGYVRKRRAGEIGRRAGDSTIRRELVALRACMNWCADPKRKPKIIDKKDVPAFDLPAESAPRDRWLRTEESQRLLTAAAEMRRGSRLSRGERFLWLALETAARKQAILDLTWDRVDFEVGVIHYKDPTKVATKKRRTSVPISKALRPVLERMYREREGDLVMDNKSDVWATVQCIAERAGFGAPRTTPRRDGMKPKKTGISPHVLRHTAATQMARRGVPLYDIAGVLGNTLAMVEKVYAKHCPGRLKAAVDSISGNELEAAE